MSTKPSRKRGFALLAVFATVMILTGVAIGLVNLSHSNLRSAFNEMQKAKGKLAAEGAIEIAIARAEANPSEKLFKGEYEPSGEDKRDQTKASYTLRRVSAARFESALSGIPGNRQVYWATVIAQTERGPKRRVPYRIDALLLPASDQQKTEVLVWNGN